MDTLITLNQLQPLLPPKEELFLILMSLFLTVKLKVLLNHQNKQLVVDQLPMKLFLTQLEYHHTLQKLILPHSVEESLMKYTLHQVEEYHPLLQKLSLHQVEVLV
jgi:hypothetical protein